MDAIFIRPRMPVNRTRIFECVKKEKRMMQEKQYLPYIRAFLEEKGWNYEYHEEDGLGSIDFSYRGVPYHIWEFEEDGERGAETNLYHGGRQQEVLGDYESELIREMKQW